MEPQQNFIEMLKNNWIQIGVFGMGLLGYFIGYQSRKDNHSISKAQKFNIDLDTLNDSFDLTQKLLKNLREQLDSTQAMLDVANRAYKLLETELQNVRDAKVVCDLKNKALIKENRELQMAINTCEFDCKFKKPVKIRTNDTDN